MAGVKGKSGRKSLRVEYGIKELRDKVIFKAWKMTDKALDSDELELKDRAGIGERLAGKDLSRKLEHSGSVMQINITPDEATAKKLANEQLAGELE